MRRTQTSTTCMKNTTISSKRTAGRQSTVRSRNTIGAQTMNLPFTLTPSVTLTPPIMLSLLTTIAFLAGPLPHRYAHSQWTIAIHRSIDMERITYLYKGHSLVAHRQVDIQCLLRGPVQAIMLDRGNDLAGPDTSHVLGARILSLTRTPKVAPQGQGEEKAIDLVVGRVVVILASRKRLRQGRPIIMLFLESVLIAQRKSKSGLTLMMF